MYMAKILPIRGKTHNVRTFNLIDRLINEEQRCIFLYNFIFSCKMKHLLVLREVIVFLFLTFTCSYIF